VTTVSARMLEQYDFEPITVTQDDFNDVPDASSGAVTVAAGEVKEVARAEIGEDGQLSSYGLFRLGQSLDGGNQNSGKGKIFVDLRDAADSEIDQRTQIRFVSRPKNDNGRTPLTSFISLRDLNVDRQDFRIPLTPVTYNGKPAFVKDGRVLAIEVRNTATDVEVDRSNCDIDAPGRAGY